jgi:hypothetical protein
MNDIGLGGVLAVCAVVLAVWFVYRLGIEVGSSRAVVAMTERLKDVRDEYGRPVLNSLLDPPSTRWD